MKRSRREVLKAGAALAVSTGPQRHIEEWVLRKRPGTEAAQAAESALAEGATSHKDDSQVAPEVSPE